MPTAGRWPVPTLCLALCLAPVVAAGLGCSNRALPLASSGTGSGGAAGAISSTTGDAGGGFAGAGGELAATPGGAGGGGPPSGAAGVGAVGAVGGGSNANGGSVGVYDCTGVPSGVLCAAGSCAGVFVTARYACDGNGNCNPVADVSCAPFVCDPQTARCRSSCVLDADCANGKPCLNGVCDPKPPGATCAANPECSSGFCVDGVCCEVACTGACLSCAIPGKLGSCLPLPAGVRDPHGLCVATPVSTCGRDGTCDGVGGCANYPAGVVCGAAGCREGVYSTIAKCNGVGTCVRSTSPCAPYACDAQAGQCKASCASDQDCAAGELCRNGLCGIKRPTPCTSNAECASGFCAQGACCKQPCDGVCQSCALPDSYGTCTALPAADSTAPGCATSQG